MKKTKLLTLLAIAAFSFNVNAQSLYIPSGTSGIGNNTIGNYIYTTPPTLVGIGIGSSTVTPPAYLSVMSQNASTTPVFQATEANSSGSAMADYFKIVNGTGNTTTFAPVLWGHNTYTATGVLPSLGLIGSTPSACDIANSLALINLNGRQLNSGVGSPILNRNILQVSNYATTLFTIGSTGNVGWGTQSFLNTDQGGSIELNGNNTNAGTTGASPFIDFHYGTGSVQDYNVRLINSGNGILELDGGSLVIGMNCAPPSGAKLGVNGSIYATGIKIELLNGSNCFPDYVFEKDYNLLSLSEVEKYIKTNKHLPDVPAAAEVEAKGMDLPEMNMILLRKVEELTLHMIEMEKKINFLEKK